MCSGQLIQFRMILKIILKKKELSIKHQASGIRHQASGIRHQASGARSAPF